MKGEVTRLAGVCGVALLACVVALPAAAADATLRHVGNAITIALPVTAIGVSLMHHRDWKGIGEFAVSTGLTVGAAYLLRQTVREQRPDHSDFHTMTPPDVALADASADYMWSRYGWRYGVPAYAGSLLVSYALSDDKKNHWYDTLASGALAFTFNYAFVERYRPQRYRLSVVPEPGGASLHFSMRL